MCFVRGIKRRPERIGKFVLVPVPSEAAAFGVVTIHGLQKKVLSMKPKHYRYWVLFKSIFFREKSV